MGVFEKIFGARRERVNANAYFKMLNGYAPAFSSWSGKIYESGLVRAAINAKIPHFKNVCKDCGKRKTDIADTAQTCAK